MRKSQRRAAQIRVAEHHGTKRVYAEIDGADVSRVYISPQRVRVGPAGEVTMAGIGAVGTKREYRRAGLMRRVYARVMQEMKRDRYSCSGHFTGTVIVAHRLYRRFGFVDVCIHRRPTKVLDLKAFVTEIMSRLAKRTALADWSGVMRVELDGHRPVYVRFEKGAAKPLSRAPKAAALSLRLSAATFAELSWRGMTPGYGEASRLVRWSGDESAWARLAEALSEARPFVHGG